MGLSLRCGAMGATTRVSATMNLNRRGFLLVVSAVVLALGTPRLTGAEEPQGNAKPNILFIAVDDLRPELGCYGNTIIKSPNIDGLARRGLTFTRAYCQQAVCSPSRSSLLTGTRPDTTKVWDLNTHFRAALPDVVTLPQFFKNHGYFAQGMGKIYHGGYEDPPSWSVPWTQPDEDKSSGRTATRPADAGKKEKGKSGEARKRDRGQAFRATDGPDNALYDGLLADMAIAALQKIQAQNQPFFLAVGFKKPHLPFVSPQQYWDLYDPMEIPLASNRFLPKDAPPYALSDGNELWNYDGVPEERHLPDDYARQLKHGYYAAVSYMDAQLGRVLAELDRLGLRDSTIIILWGDHGWKLGEHDRWCKHSNVENDTNAPLILSVPGMPSAGEHTDALVEFVDIYPTLADLAGLEKPGHLEGTSAAPLIADPNQPWKRAAYSQYPRNAEGKKLMGYSKRTERYRITRWVERTDHTKVVAIELYDHKNDPEENTNIAGDPANKELVEQLLQNW